MYPPPLPHLSSTNEIPMNPLRHLIVMGAIMIDRDGVRNDRTEEYVEGVGGVLPSPTPTQIPSDGHQSNNIKRINRNQYIDPTTSTYSFALMEVGAESMVRLELVLSHLYSLVTTNPLETEVVQGWIATVTDWIEKQKAEAEAMAAANAAERSRSQSSEISNSTAAGEESDSVQTITKIQFLEQELQLLRQQMQQLAAATSQNQNSSFRGGPCNGLSTPPHTHGGHQPQNHHSAMSCDPNNISCVDTPISFRNNTPTPSKYESYSVNNSRRWDDDDTFMSASSQPSAASNSGAGPKLPTSLVLQIQEGKNVLKKSESARSPGGTPCASRSLTFESGIENALKQAMQNKFKKARDSLSPTSAKREMQNHLKSISSNGGAVTPVKEEVSRRKPSLADSAWNRARRPYTANPPEALPSPSSTHPNHMNAAASGMIHGSSLGTSSPHPHNPLTPRSNNSNTIGDEGWGRDEDKYSAMGDLNGIDNGRRKSLLVSPEDVCIKNIDDSRRRKIRNRVSHASSDRGRSGGEEGVGQGQGQGQGGPLTVNKENY